MSEDLSPREPAFKVLASNRWFIVGEDDEGYGIWSVTDEGDAPLRRFPPTDEGSEEAFDEFTSMSRARRRSPLQGALLWAAAISGLIWVLSNGYVAIALALDIGSGFGGGLDSALYEWLSQISQTAYPVFAVSAGLYVLLWLSSRDTRG